MFAIVTSWRQRRRLARELAPFVKDHRDRIAALRFVRKQATDPHHVAIAKSGRIFTCHIPRFSRARKSWLIRHSRASLPVVLDLASRLSVDAAFLHADLGDGEWADPIELRNDPQRDFWRLSFCSYDPRAVLIVDHEFHGSRGYAEHRALAAAAPDWSARSDDIVWRGSTTGKGRLPDDGCGFDDPALLPRIRLCALLKDVPGVDARINNIVHADDPVDLKQRLQAAGLFGDRIRTRTWLERRHALDIDGNSNAWSNPFIRMLYGCCVIKVESPRGYRQWYYDRMQAWEHYVPVRPDLGDLIETIDWCRSNPGRCREIAEAGRAMVRAITFESAIAECVQRIEDKLRASA